MPIPMAAVISRPLISHLPGKVQLKAPRGYLPALYPRPTIWQKFFHGSRNRVNGRLAVDKRTLRINRVPLHSCIAVSASPIGRYPLANHLLAFPSLLFFAACRLNGGCHARMASHCHQQWPEIVYAATLPSLQFGAHMRKARLAFMVDE